MLYKKELLLGALAESPRPEQFGGEDFDAQAEVITLNGLRLRSAQKKEEFENDLFLFAHAESIGADFIEANKGLLPDQDHLRALKEQGFLDASVQDITRLFYDIKDFQTFAANRLAINQATRLLELRTYLKEIKQGTKDGSLSTELFRRRKAPIDKTVLVRRYLRYKVLKEVDSREKIGLDDNQAIAMARGFRLSESKAPNSGFLNEFIKRYKNPTEQQNLKIITILAAEDMGIDHLVLPYLRQDYLKQLKVDRLIID